MIIVGSPGAWGGIVEDMLPSLLRLVLETWNMLSGPLPDNKEDQITTVLYKALLQNRDLRDLPFYVMLQMVELNSADGQGPGRLDIAFLPTGAPGAPREDIYFCLECKRLNIIIEGKKVPGGSEYVKHGMMRFVLGQYAKSVWHGGMLGYVLDGNVTGAIANIKSNVKSKCSDLCMESPGVLHPSSVLPDVTTVKESFHQRSGDTVRFRIHHIFVEADGLFA